MYKISVPIYNENVQRNGREQTLKELIALDAKRVFLGCGIYKLDPKERQKEMEEVADNCRFLKAHGFEVGAWVWTFWLRGEHSYRCMRSITGKEIKEFMCPTDEGFVAYAADYIKDYARCGVDIIQFDDDFRYGFLSDSAACLCDGHIERINRITGECSTREELEKHITSGGKNKYRDAFLQVNGDALRNFAKTMRKAVDEVNPSIRISLCSCLSSWDLDGTDARELATILAGNTQPLLRLIGAPYWAVKKQWGCSLQDVIELERMESAWTRAEGIEIMAEGDVYPRPRTVCPASYLEGFDTAIRASGCTDGILKYGIEYNSNADYEMGYVLLHEHNRELYPQIDELFSQKASCGVRVYESMKKIADAVTPTRVNQTVQIENLFFSMAARTLAYNTIPTVYEGDGVCGIVFDENARNLPTEALSNGMILDVAAAEILTERGIDVGLENIGEAIVAPFERFHHNNNHLLGLDTVIYNITVKSGVEILSSSETSHGVIPVSYRYENAEGQRFLVLNINTRSPKDNLLKHYERSRQFAEQIPWLGGKRLPAYAYGNPALYLQCKKGENCMAVGLWNFFADPIFSPTVTLDEEYTSIRCVNCTGSVEGNRVRLSQIHPFGFAFFEVKK